jgi:AhpD family alkylhydroperoxidase
MTTDLKNRLSQINQQFSALGQAQPAAMSAFQGLMKSATQEGSLPTAVKELVAVALAVQKGCDDCVLFHASQAVRHRATREQLAEVLAINIEMGGGPGAIYASKALAYFDALSV